MVIQFSRLGIIKKFLIAFQLLSDLGTRISATAKATPICFNSLSASVRIWTVLLRRDRKPHRACLNRLSASVRIWTGKALRCVRHLLWRVLIAFRLQSEFGQRKKNSRLLPNESSLNRLSASVRIWTNFCSEHMDSQLGLRLNRLSASVRIWTAGTRCTSSGGMSSCLNRLSASVRIWTG